VLGESCPATRMLTPFSLRRLIGLSLVHPSQGLPRRNQLRRSSADQIGPAHARQRLSQQRPIVRVMPAQEGFVQPALTRTLGRCDVSAFAVHLAQRVLARVVHGRGASEWRGQKGLHLIRAKAVAFQP